MGTREEVAMKKLLTTSNLAMVLCLVGVALVFTPWAGAVIWTFDPTAQAVRQTEYETNLLNPYVAAERGFVDMVIDPAETRAVVADALRSLDHKRESLRGRKHSNTPL